MQCNLNTGLNTDQSISLVLKHFSI